MEYWRKTFGIAVRFALPLVVVACICCCGRANAGKDEVRDKYQGISVAANGGGGMPIAVTLTDAQKATLDGLIASLKTATELEKAYRIAENIEDLGTAAAPALKAAIKDIPELPRIAGLRALYGLREWDTAVQGLADITAGEGARETRVAAAELTAVLASPRHEEMLKRALDVIFDTPVRIELSLALWRTAKSPRARQELYDLLESTSDSFRIQAALALGRMGDNTGKVKEVLNTVQDEPTVRGQTAKAIIQRDELIKELEAATFRKPNGEKRELVQVDVAILGKLQEMLQERYIYAERVEATRLTQMAAEGVLSGLDPYTVYLKEKQLRNAAALREFRVPSLGLSLGASPLRKGRKLRVTTVLSVTPGGPADFAGLRPGDKVFDAAPLITDQKIAAWRTGKSREEGETLGDKFIEARLGDQVDMLGGEAGTSVGLLVRRDDWLLARWVRLVHAQPKHDCFAHEMLPGAMGYVRIFQFDADTHTLFDKAIKEFKAAGAKGLLLDLRDVSGGNVDAAVRVASMLLPRRALVCYSEGLSEDLGKKREYLAEGDVRDTDLPVTALINGGTADAGEILAAALQDHKRARIAGAPSYGRAIVQELFPLKAAENNHALLITVAKFFTPDKRKLYDTGVTPDVTGQPELFEGWVYDELDDLRTSGKLDAYVDGLISKQADKALELAKGDGFDISKYPDFAAFKATAASHLSDEHLRWITRRSLRLRMKQDGKLAGVADLQADREFIAGLRDLAQRVSVDLAKFDEYRFISRE